MSGSMNWSQLLVEERFGTETKKKEDGRSQFEKDIDRITFSGSFRRLGRKTQVHPLNENDHIHTRLSHSLEVACVGRSLGVMVGNFLTSKEELPKGVLPSNIGEIVQAACLAHDIGNPPFGHAGEEVIRKWFEQAFDDNAQLKHRLLSKEKEKDLTCFDGNAMAFRVATYKEYFMGRGGMRLTYPTLGALLKYPWTSHYCGDKKKYSCFQTEFENLNTIAQKMGLINIKLDKKKSKAKYVRHPLAFLVEAADDICYRILDLEDASELGLVQPNFIDKQFRPLLKLSEHETELIDLPTVSLRTKMAFIRGKMMELLIADIVNAFRTNYDEIMSGKYDKALIDADGVESFKGLHRAYETVRADVFTSKRKVILEIGAFSTLGTVLTTFSQAAFQTCCLDKNERSFKTQKIYELLKKNLPHLEEPDPKFLYIGLMMVMDYITGMTDHYATEINRKILGLGM